jgi:hypothetical protein
LRCRDIVLWTYYPRSGGNALPLVDSKEEGIDPSRIEDVLEEMLRKNPLVTRVVQASASSADFNRRKLYNRGCNETTMYRAWNSLSLVFKHLHSV